MSNEKVQHLVFLYFCGSYTVINKFFFFFHLVVFKHKHSYKGSLSAGLHLMFSLIIEERGTMEDNSFIRNNHLAIQVLLGLSSPFLDLYVEIKQIEEKNKTINVMMPSDG